MVALVTQTLSYPAPLAPSYVAANAGGDTVKAGDNVRLFVKNGGGASINVTIPRYPAVDLEGVAETPLVVAVAAGAERWIGPLYGSRYTNPATQNVEAAYSGVTTVSVAAVAMS